MGGGDNSDEEEKSRKGKGKQTGKNKAVVHNLFYLD